MKPMQPPSRVSVINVEIGDIQPAEDNPNVMTEEEVASLERGVSELGFLQPLLVRHLPDEMLGTAPAAGTPRYEIIDGHHRFEVAKKLEMPIIPCVLVEDMSEEQVRITRIAMNKNRGELDLTATGRHLRALAADYELDLSALTLTGYSESEVKDLLRTEGDMTVTSGDFELELPPEIDDADDDAPAADKLFSLELTFKDRETLKRVKRRLKKASGKAKDMAEGLLRLIGEDE